MVIKIRKIIIIHHFVHFALRYPVLNLLCEVAGGVGVGPFVLVLSGSKSIISTSFSGGFGPLVFTGSFPLSSFADPKETVIFSEYFSSIGVAGLFSGFFSFDPKNAKKIAIIYKDDYEMIAF